MTNDLVPAQGLLETMTISDVRSFQPEVMLIPLGSTEPHGPHLPYGADTFICDGITAEAVRLANGEGARVLRLPPLPIGNNVNFKAFPFACRLRVETLMAILCDLAGFALEEGVRKVVIVNAHGGNDDTLRASLRQIYDRYGSEMFVCGCGASQFCNGLAKELFTDHSPHAGDAETSSIMHLAPKLVVDSGRRPYSGNEPVIPALSQVLWVRPWHRFMPESCMGRPDESSAGKGEAFCKASAAGLARFLVELSRAPWSLSFPYQESNTTS